MPQILCGHRSYQPKPPLDSQGKKALSLRSSYDCLNEINKIMPINRLNKATPRGKGPPPSNPYEDQAQQAHSAEKEEQELDRAAKEIYDMWEEEESGGTRWSGGDEDKRYAD